jgi:hypothetical protein
VTGKTISYQTDGALKQAPFQSPGIPHQPDAIAFQHCISQFASRLLNQNDLFDSIASQELPSDQKQEQWICRGLNRNDCLSFMEGELEGSRKSVHRAYFPTAESSYFRLSIEPCIDAVA